MSLLPGLFRENVGICALPTTKLTWIVALPSSTNTLISKDFCTIHENHSSRAFNFVAPCAPNNESSSWRKLFTDFVTLICYRPLACWVRTDNGLSLQVTTLLSMVTTVIRWSRSSLSSLILGNVDETGFKSEKRVS